MGTEMIADSTAQQLVKALERLEATNVALLAKLSEQDTLKRDRRPIRQSSKAALNGGTNGAPRMASEHVDGDHHADLAEVRDEGAQPLSRSSPFDA